MFLLRHGESDWNAEGRLQGTADPALSAAGREQARALAPVVAELPATAAVTSDLARARDTAALTGHPGAQADPRWRERDLGEWQTRLEADIDPDAMAAFRRGEYVPPGGEAWPDFQARVAAAVADLTARGGDWLVFTHGGCVRAAVAALTGADWRAIAGPANTSVSVLRTGARPRVLAFNWTPEPPGLARPSDPGA
jgi:broad specificity phosphatase PhoE